MTATNSLLLANVPHRAHRTRSKTGGGASKGNKTAPRKVPHASRGDADAPRACHRECSDAEPITEQESDSEETSSDMDSDVELLSDEDDMEGFLREEASDRRYLRTVSPKRREFLVGELTRLSGLHDGHIPVKFRIADSALPDAAKQAALSMGASSEDKAEEWVSQLLRVPVGKYCELPPHEKHEEVIRMAKYRLDENIYGNAAAKMVTLELMAQMMTNPTASPQCIGLVGPPGVAKTTLARTAIATCLCGDESLCCMIPCGTITDAAVLSGHSYTYEGAIPGRIVGALQQAGVMNPVLFFDEVDKISDSSKGQEISRLLMALTDPSQNAEFIDAYFHGMKFDLSRAFIVLSMNKRGCLDAILQDRIQFIEMMAPKKKDKLQIARKHILPDCLAAMNMYRGMELADDALEYLIDKVGGEGMRPTKHALFILARRINLARVTNVPMTHTGLVAMERNLEERPTKRKRSFVTKEILISLLPDVLKGCQEHPFINTLYI